jgi:hypothetical protein
MAQHFGLIMVRMLPMLFRFQKFLDSANLQFVNKKTDVQVLLTTSANNHRVCEHI